MIRIFSFLDGHDLSPLIAFGREDLVYIAGENGHPLAKGFSTAYKRTL